MTKKEALSIALTTMTNDEAKTVIQKMIDQLAQPRTPLSDEAKARANAARKEKTAAARAALMKEVLPVLRSTLSKYDMSITAKELYENAKDNLPSDFTASKVQYVLLHELVDEVDKIEDGRNAYTYRLKRG